MTFWRNCQIRRATAGIGSANRNDPGQAPNVTNIACQFDRTDRARIEADLMTKRLHSARDEGDKLAVPLAATSPAVAVSKYRLTIAGALTWQVGHGKN